MHAYTPPFLKTGDEIRIISTARRVDREFIDHACLEIQNRGFKASLGQNLFKVSNQFAGTDQERLADLNDALNDPSVRAIFCARGGYGTARLLEGMDNDAFSGDPKWIVGYSDITALHHHLLQVLNSQSLHAGMPVNFSENTPKAKDTLFGLLSGNEVDYQADFHILNREGSGEGMMVGGNLSVMYSLLGSSAQLSTEGCILFLEDLDEYLYHIDRMMLALDRADMLKNLSGLIIGGMTDMNDNNIPFGKTAEEIIAERVGKFDFPVCFNFPSGHVKDNCAWIHGKKIRLTVKNGQPSFIVST